MAIPRCLLAQHPQERSRTVANQRAPPSANAMIKKPLIPGRLPRECAGMEAACFEKTLGNDCNSNIRFYKLDGTCCFAPEALLSRAVLMSHEELTFRFGSSIIVIRGRNLEPIWSIAAEDRLMCVREIEEPADEKAPWVREIVFLDEGEEPDPLPFPTET